MGGPSQATQQAQTNLANTQQAQSAQAMQQQQQLFSSTFPGIQTAEAQYNLLSQGNPNALMTAEAPAINAIEAQKQSAINTIQNTLPRGGQQNLALAQASNVAGSDVGNLLSTAYNNSFAALANLGTSGVGLSINELANSISGLGQASQTLSSLGSEETAGKASTLGFIGALGGAGASGLGAAFGGG